MNKEFNVLIIKDKVFNSKNRKVNINLKTTNRICMFILRYKQTIALNDLCLDLNQLIIKLQRIGKYLFQSYVIKINKINQNIRINKLYKSMNSKIALFEFNKMNKLLKKKDESKFKNSKIDIYLIIVFRFNNYIQIQELIVFNKMKELLKKKKK